MNYVCQMTVQEGSYELIRQLKTIYPEGEAQSIADRVLENITGSSRTERMRYKTIELLPEEVVKLKNCIERLLQHEPVQYVLNEAWFGGYRFFVDENVLIPRPETDELVEWIISDCRFPIAALSLLDIGTGSGCIPVSLKRRLRKAKVSACDISEAALNVARKNAETLQADIHFYCLNFLQKKEWDNLPVVDIIVSNPPYIPFKDKESLDTNVLKYEPHTALFVPDEDPLVFYKAIAEFGKSHLNASGHIYCEIHESMGDAALKIFEQNGYKTQLRKDMQGKNRMLRAALS